MKFNTLYKRLFITEDEDSVVADPSDPDFDVEPLPAPAEDTEEEVSPEYEEDDNEPSGGKYNVDTLQEFIAKLEEYADSLNGTEGDSLQKVASKLSRPETPFERLSQTIDSKVVNAAGTLHDIAEDLKNFTIQAMKVKS